MSIAAASACPRRRALGLLEGVQYLLIITAHQMDTSRSLGPILRHTVLLDDTITIQPTGTAEQDLDAGRHGARAAAAQAPELTRGVLQAQVSDNEQR